MPFLKTDVAHQVDIDNLEQVGGTQSFRFGGNATGLNFSQRSLMSATGSLSSQFSVAGFSTATTGAETTLVSFTIPASTLDIVGRGLLITVFGSATFASGTAVAKVYFGSVGTSVGTLATTNAFYSELYVFKTASSVQIGVFNTTANTTGAAPLILSQTETDTSAIVIKVTGNQSAVANAVVVNGFLVTGFN